MRLNAGNFFYSAMRVTDVEALAPYYFFILSFPRFFRLPVEFKRVPIGENTRLAKPENFAKESHKNPKRVENKSWMTDL